ncbi:Flg_bb_rod domain-containing protein [Rubrivivax sp. A210]|uniref:flagellar basal body protein n=1 Tax=Rubrivivax sp. A210 TaxID=2772301 RepID=UPI001917DB1E|nr:flagellar basal body protein [Rubrivivax sp. A210]CAD5366168.1 Flg_bb_rod domain-containing protein [Rubrivivax sp. A210]
MGSFSSIAVSGMNAAQARLDAAAHNIANAQTPALRRLQVVSASQPQGGGVSTAVSQREVDNGSLESDMVDQIVAKHSFLANLAVFRAGDRMLGTLLDERA